MGSMYRGGVTARLAGLLMLISALTLGGAAEAGRAASPPASQGAPTPSALTWTRLDGMVEAFEGSVVWLHKRGPDGYLALGRSQTTGLPRAWRSTDGLAWERVPLPPTTFGGGPPSALVWGPDGWVALGWQLTLKHGVRQQVWLSADGVTWEPDPDPSGIAMSKNDYWRSLGVTERSIVIAEDGPVPYRTSPDGRVWRSTKRNPWPAPPGLEPVIDGDILAGPRGYLFDAWPDLWTSTDGAAWTEAAYPGDGERLELVGWEGGWIAHAQERIADGIWYSADGSTWTAGTVMDPVLAEQDYLRLVSLDDSRLMTIAGDRGVVTAAWIGTFGSPGGLPRVTMTGAEPVDPAVDPNIVPLVRPPGVVCPPKPRTLRKLSRIPGWKAAACFGDGRIRAVGPAYTTREQPGESGTAYDNALFVGASNRGYAPVLGPGPIEYGNGVRDVVMIGHFVDPSCTIDPAGYPTPAASLLDCQERFTPTSIRPVRR